MNAPEPRRPHLGGPDAPVVVLAGGTGTGKSTVARWLAERGAMVLDADRIGHETLLDTRVREAIVAEFGTDVLGSDGEIDRRALGPRVFSDPEALRRLDGIVHPPLVAEIVRRIDHLRRSRATTLVVVDAALWWQFEGRPAVDLVLMTSAPVELRTRRIMERDGLDEAAARARIERQSSIDAFLDRADAVLDTTDSPDAVRARLLTLLDERVGTRLRASDPPAALDAGTDPDPSRPS